MTGRCGDRLCRCAIFSSLVMCAAIASMPFHVSAQEPDGLATAAALERAFVQVIGQTEKSVVSIARVRLSPSQRNSDQADFNPFGLDLAAADARQLRTDPDSPDFIPNEFGTGILVAPEGRPDDRLIVTNYHVVRGGPVAGSGAPAGDTRLYIWLAGGRSCAAAILAADPRSDLAVLKADFAKLGLKPAELAALNLRPATAPLKKGQLVLALGNPYAIARDGSASISWGIISNISRRPAPVEPMLDETSISKETLHHLGTLLQVDTRLNLGTSGGALVNLRGELVGITTSLAALQGYEKSVGYAVPIDAVTRRIIQDLCRGHEVEFGFLGLMPENVLPEEIQRRAPDLRQISAAKVVSVIPGSPSAVAGLTRDDWILDVNGEQVKNRVDLMRLVGQLPPESAVRLRVWRVRAQRELTLTVKLGKWPVFDDEGIIATVPRYPDWRGLAVDYPTGRKKYFDWPHEFHEAVVITKIIAGSKSQTAGLHEGEFITHVNGQPVRTPGEFHMVVKSQEGDVTLDLVGDRRVVVPK